MSALIFKLRIPGTILITLAAFLLLYGQGAFLFPAAAVLEASDHFFTFLYTRGSLYVIDGVKGLLELRGERLVPVPGGEFLRAHVLLPFGDNKLFPVTYPDTLQAFFAKSAGKDH